MIPLFFFFPIIELPAYFFLVFWFVLQVLNGLASLSVRDPIAAHGVAWWAHIGGFATGLAIARRWDRPVARRRSRADEAFPW